MHHLSFIPAAWSDSYLVRLIVASVFGALVGLERDIHGRAAGLRTNLLVSLGAALFMIISEAVAGSFGGDSSATAIRSDPTRIAAQIVSGIGFLGAGAIIKNGFSIRGLTTAASMWTVAAIGMAAGAGYYELAGVATIAALISLIVLNRFERLYAKDSYRTLTVTAPIDTEISTLIDAVKRKNLKIIHFDYTVNYRAQELRALFTIRILHRGVTDKLSHAIVEDLERAEGDLHEITWGHE